MCVCVFTAQLCHAASVEKHVEIETFTIPVTMQHSKCVKNMCGWSGGWLESCQMYCFPKIKIEMFNFQSIEQRLDRVMSPSTWDDDFTTRRSSTTSSVSTTTPSKSLFSRDLVILQYLRALTSAGYFLGV